MFLLNKTDIFSVCTIVEMMLVCQQHWTSRYACTIGAHNCPSPTIYTYIYIYICIYSSGTHAQDHKLHVSKKPCAKQMYLRLGALVRGIP